MVAADVLGAAGAGPAVVDPPVGVAAVLHRAASASTASAAAPPVARPSARVVDPLLSMVQVSGAQGLMSVGPGRLIHLDLGPHFSPRGLPGEEGGER